MKKVLTLVFGFYFLGCFSNNQICDMEDLSEMYIAFSYDKKEYNNGEGIIDYINLISKKCDKAQLDELQFFKSRIYFMNNEIEKSLSVLNSKNLKSNFEATFFRGIVNELSNNKEKAIRLYRESLDSCNRDTNHCWILDFIISNNVEKFKNDAKLESESFGEVIDDMFNSKDYEKDRRAYLYHLFIENV